jgi:hydrogenase maturation protein HypF
MALEFVASSDPGLSSYPLEIAGRSEIDWTPLLPAILDDLDQGEANPARISRRFHLTLADLIAQVAAAAKCETVALTGGCFQNALLLELTIGRLQTLGLRPIWHRRVPPNDGGLAFGQAVVASRRLASQTG